MDFNINGISFNKTDLVTVPIKNFSVGTISNGHVFLILGNKPFLLLRAGDYIDGEFLQKYLDRGLESFWFLEIADKDTITKYHSLFSELRNSKSSKLQAISSEKIYISFVKDFILENKVSFLSFIVAAFNTFYRFDHGTALKFHQTSTTLFDRALVTSAHSILVTMSNGFKDYNFIRDIYNLAFIMDIGLLEGEFSYNIQKACEQERNYPGTGTAYLQSVSKQPEELDLFMHHPSFSMHYAESMPDRFEYPELCQVLAIHHEKFDGSGFPNGYFRSSISSWECILNFVDLVTHYKTRNYNKGDGKSILNETSEYLKSLETKEKQPLNDVIDNYFAVIKWASLKLTKKEAA